jgi:hypothetical protein
MVSNQPPPFPAFVGANPEVSEDPSEQLVVTADDERDAVPGTESSAVDDAFANLTPDHPEE